MNDIIRNKIAIIERCLKRIKEEYIGNEDKLSYDYSRQDSIILNLQRACEAAIDLARISHSLSDNLDNLLHHLCPQ